MKKVNIPMFVYFQKWSFDEFGSYVAYSFKSYDSENLTFVCQQDVDFNLPEKYDPTAQKILALELEKVKINEAFAKSIFNLNQKISKLQALEFTP